MSLKGWNHVEIKKEEELNKDAWAQGFFHSSHESWDGKSWTRNFHELMIRDLFLFTLGDVKDKRILDIGCGEGAYLDIIAKWGGQIFGQDINSEYVNKALKNLKEKGHSADIKVGTAAKILFNDNCFDAVFAADLFEHMSYDEKNRAISEVYRVLKPGGLFVIKTPNFDYLKMSSFLKRMSAVFKFKLPFNIHIPHTHNNPDNQHCGLTTYTELEELLFNNMFHFPKVTYVPLLREKLPRIITKLLYGKRRFCEQIIIATRKPLFLGFYP